VYSWGLGTSGQLGIGSSVSQWSPSKILFDGASIFIYKGSAGIDFSALLDGNSILLISRSRKTIHIWSK
jgi:hypothetical protein